MSRYFGAHVLLATVLGSLGAGGLLAAEPLGIFESHQDIGTILHPGGGTFDDAKKAYTVAGSGANLWYTSDGFHYVWKKATGDVSPRRPLTGIVTIDAVVTSAAATRVPEGSQAGSRRVFLGSR